MMTNLRSYGEPCGIARALDVIGERWALLIVRELLFGPKRFTDIKAALGASPNVLSHRLGELEENGVVQRRSAGGALYQLTEWGSGLHPILLKLGLWGARSSHMPTGTLSVDALMAALEATVVPENAAGLRAQLELRVGEERFIAEVDHGTIAITRGSLPNPHAVIDTDAATLRALAFGDCKLAEAPVEIRGNATLAQTFFNLFARPDQG